MFINILKPGQAFRHAEEYVLRWFSRHMIVQYNIKFVPFVDGIAETALSLLLL